MCALIARTARPVTLVATVIRKMKEKKSAEEVKKKSRKGERGTHQRQWFATTEGVCSLQPYLSLGRRRTFNEWLVEL